MAAAPMTPPRPSRVDRLTTRSRVASGANGGRRSRGWSPEVAGARDAAADDDQRRVEEVHDARQHPADQAAGVRDQLDAGGVAVRRGPREVAGGRGRSPSRRAAWRGRTAALLARRSASRPSRPAARPRGAVHVPAAADDVVAVRVEDLDVADVACAALGAPVQAALDDDPGADARADLDEDDVLVLARDAARSSPSAITFTSLSTQTGTL